MKINNPNILSKQKDKERKWLEQYRQLAGIKSPIFLSDKGEFDFIKQHSNK